MSYNDIAAMAHDTQLRDRIVAAAAQDIVAAPGWADAYGYALAGNHANPGYAEAVVSDAMILSAVQARVQATSGA